MRIIFLTNNYEISHKLINFLKNDLNEEVIEFNDKILLEDIIRIKADFIISYNYRYKINLEIIKAMPKKIINLHISYLPWNRGSHPNIWSIIEETPKGVTIHYVDEYIDTGEIILQKKVYINESVETLRSSYILLHKNIQDLFFSNWCKIKKSQIESFPQPSGGTKHLNIDFEKIRHIFDERNWDITINEFKNKYQEYMKEKWT